MCISKIAEKTQDILDRPLDYYGINEYLWSNKCDYINPDSCINLNPNEYNLIALQLNVRSILSNQIELKQLLQTLENKNSHVDIVLLCETFLSSKIV